MCAGDFSGVYERHASQVYDFFAYQLRSRVDAEDLTQMTFERALRAWGRYDDSRGSASAWLRVIARNLFVDHLRTNRAAPAQPLAERDLEDVGATLDQPRLGLDPQLERALSELGTRERTVIALRFGGDLTAAQISDLTGLGLANVQQILSRSLRRMRASLDRGSGGGAAERAEAA